MALRREDGTGGSSSRQRRPVSVADFLAFRSLSSVLIAAVCLLLIAGSARSGFGDSHDERFLQGLRERRLFEQAEKYCSDRLLESQLSEARRVDLAIELSRTFAEHAAASPLEAQPPLWQKARQVVDEFAAKNPTHPRLLLVRVQGLLAALAQGELEREEADLAGAPRALDEAGKALHDTIVQLRKMDDEISAEIKRRARPARTDSQRPLSADELSSLQLHVRSQLARGLRNLGLCYPPSSADRINALTQAMELLSELAQQDPQTTLAWSSRLDEIGCLRLLEDYTAVERQLKQLEKSSPPPQVEGRLRAERIRLALARGELDRALTEADRAGAVSRADWADANCAQLEAYLAARDRAQLRHDDKEAAEWEQAAVRQVRAIEIAYGTFWMRKAETLLARSMAKSAGSESAEALVRAAESFYRSGRIDEALATYDRAARRASGNRDTIQAFEIAYTAATLEKQREHYRPAIDRYRALSMAAPEHSKAGEAHLLAIYCAAQLSGRQKPPQLDEYERLLREHVATWPKDATASQAWWWLGRLKEHAQALQEAIQCLRNVKADHPRYADAVEAVGRCYATHLSELRRNDNANVQLAKEAARYFEQIVTPARGPQGAAPAVRAAALAAANLWLKEIPDGAARAEQILNAALASSAAAPPQWQGDARSLLVPALAAQGRIREAEELLNQIPAGSVDRSLAMIDTLTEVTDRAAADRKRGLAELQLVAIGDLLVRRDELDPMALNNISRLQAATLAEAGRRAQAIEVLESLAKENPRDGQTQEEIASLLAAGEDAVTLGAALAKWREVTGKSRPGSPRWFRAQWGVARTQLNLGNPAEARSTIKRVESAHPDFGGREMKARFQKLLVECERRPPDFSKKQK
jgi:tetratricopeptide (TPR) repeat protein